MNTNKLMSDDHFGKMPVFPQPAVYDPQREQVNSAYQYGCEMGLNMQQYVWLQIYASVLADGNSTYANAIATADGGLPDALKRLKELA